MDRKIAAFIGNGLTHSVVHSLILSLCIKDKIKPSYCRYTAKPSINKLRCRLTINMMSIGCAGKTVLFLDNIPERLRDASCGGAIQIDYLYLFTFTFIIRCLQSESAIMIEINPYELPDFWPPNRPDLKTVAYKIWGSKCTRQSRRM